MPQESQAVTNEEFQKDIREMIVSALQDLEKNQNIEASWVPGYDALKSVVDSMYKLVDKTASEVGRIEKNMVNMVTQFNPKIPHLYAVDEIVKIIQFSKRGFNTLPVISALESLSTMQGKLKATNKTPLAGLFDELGLLSNNLDNIISEYAPDFVNSMLDEVNTGIENSIKVADQLEKCVTEDFGVHVPQSLDIESLTRSLAIINKQLASVDIKTLDKNVDKEWKPIKIGLICALGLIKDALNLMGNVMPLNISLGGSGGVAAGVDVEAKASASVISLGKVTWGSVATIVSMIMNIINTCDAYINLRISERKAA